MSGYRRALLFALAFVLTACSGPQRSATPVQRQPSPTPSPKPTMELPFVGPVIFPKYRVVAYYGSAATPAMGILGDGSPEQAARRLTSQAKAYDSLGRPVIPALELIATMAQGAPGLHDRYNMPTDGAVVARYLDAARRAKALLIIDVQPGRASFLPEVKRYERFLLQPDVGLALDPEWEMSAGQIPAQTIGHTTAAEVNAVSAYLSNLVQTRHLPQKVLLVHQFIADMVLDRRDVRPRPGLAVTFNIDGFGSRAGKLSKYKALSTAKGPFFNGIKLFYKQDIDMFSARETAGLKPSPNIVVYQ
ncbi:MAG: hypothetical protein GIW99_12585 [Candidatus Eremiobacteraeota bacterium]|nr:hypothetical protein [Candidatus Eremiobacteraeota bacterium]MBC5828495.1 hypothetical protein [Candidatus Eremiobacteraeota bacterium]